MRRILVTGAAGFVGRHLLAALAGGADVAPDGLLGIGRGDPDGLPAAAGWRAVDLLDARALVAALAGFRPTHVVHLAALSSVQQAAGAPTQTWSVNVAGLINLADAVVREAPGATLVFVSSGEVYGRAFLRGEPVTEAATPEPLATYARSKWVGEQILADLLPKGGVRRLVVRPFNHVGPGQDERFVVASFAGQIARIEAGLIPPVLEVGNLAAARDFLAVEDVVDAYVRLIDRAEALPDGAVFNVASGEARTVESVLAGLRALSRRPFEVRTAADRIRPSDIPVAAGDAAALAAATGWRPGRDWAGTLAGVLADARARAASR